MLSAYIIIPFVNVFDADTKMGHLIFDPYVSCFRMLDCF